MAVITASPKSFSRLIELQEVANENLRSIRSVVEMSRTLDVSTTVKPVSTTPSGFDDASVVIEKETLKTQKEMLALSREQARINAEEAEAIATMAEGMKTFKTIGERLGDLKKGITDKFSISNMMKSMNFGGVLNKSIAREDFIKQQKAIDPTKSRKELAENFKGAQAASKDIKKNEAALAEFKKTTGLSDADVAKTAKGKELLAKRETLTSDYSKFDLRSQFVRQGSDSGAMAQAPMTNLQPVTASTAAQSAGEQQEAQMENARLMNDQTDLLQKIEENTRGDSASQKAKSASTSGDSGGMGLGLLGGLGLGLKALGAGLRGLMSGAGRGIAVFLQGIARGLISIGRAIASLGGSVGTGLVKFLRGLARGLAALANPASLIGLAAFTLAMMGLGKALEYAAPAIEAFAPVLMKVAEVVGGIFIAAIEKIPEIIRSVGDVVIGIIGAISDSITGIIDAVTSSIERLAAIDGSNLLSVGAGLVAVAGGLIAFSAAQVGAGIGNLVSGLFAKITGQKTPVEQLEQIAGFGANLEKAGIGVEKLGGGLQAFSSIDAAKIKAISTLPVEKIAAMGAAMNTPAAKVAASSAQNQAAKMAANNNSGASTNIVSAPVNNVSTTNNSIKAPVRNQESSQSKYVSNKLAVK